MKIEKAVTNIVEKAFAGCISLKDVSISDGVQLGTGAFMSCTSLKSIKLPSVVVSDSVFSGCISLKEVEFHPQQKSIPQDMFKGCGFKKFTLPDSIISIGSGAFSYNGKLSKFTLGKGILALLNVKSWFTSSEKPGIDDDALDAMGVKIDIEDVAYPNLNFTMVISPTVMGIPADTFVGLGYFNVEIDEENPFFYVKDHSIIEKTSNKLIATFGVVDEIYKLPSEIEFIEDEDALKSAEPYVFEDIEGKEFSNEYPQRVLKIPKSVKEYYDIDIDIICYEGEYYQTDSVGRYVYASKKYIYPTINGKTRNVNCDYEKTNIRHRIGLTGTEIGLIVGVIIVALLLIGAIILYIFLPLTKLIMKAATNDVAP